MYVVYIVGLTAVLMFVVELLCPGRPWPRVSGWWGRAILLNGMQIGSVFISGIAWDRWMPGNSLWSLGDMPMYLQVLAGYLAITFIYYWWHRFRHESNFLWRWFHQVHHSPQRIEIITSFYKHPIEIIGNSILSSFILYLLCGVNPQAAAVTVMITGLAELFYHWNVKTPYWLGFFFQRPESHCIHHELNQHRNNYSDLPIWDMMFGTFHNPKEWKSQCGFDQHREARLGAMLAGNDVNESLSKEDNPPIQ